jgi:hypothetical protein
MPILIVVGLMMLSGVSYLVLVNNLDDNNSTFYIILVLGVIIRLSMLLSSPIITVDYLRYQWDGAVLANGINPYLYSPAQVLSYDAPQVLIELASHPDSTLSSVIFPEIRTPYPPVAQIIFALSHILQPWSLQAWRLVILTFDFLTLLLLLQMLKELRLPVWSVGFYWLNPVLVKEVINSGHMDVLVLPFLMAGCLKHISGKYYQAILLLALSVCVKIWPIVLLPVFIRPIIPEKGKVALVTLLFTAVCALIFYPVYSSGLDGTHGMMAYAGGWEYNASLFRMIQTTSERILSAFNSSLSEGIIARAFTAILFAFWTLTVLRKPGYSRDFLRQCLLIIAGLLMLNPTFFPWYYVWLVPFLVFHPNLLTLFSALLPVYYLRFHYIAQDNVQFFDKYIVWLQFAPVWAMIINEWLLSCRINHGYGEDTETRI